MAVGVVRIAGEFDQDQGRPSDMDPLPFRRPHAGHSSFFSSFMRTFPNTRKEARDVQL